MAEPKTKPTTQPPEEFLNTVEPESKRKDGFTLLEVFKKATGEKPVMWGSSIVGFGQKNGWPMVGFSPRKQYLTLYVIPQDMPLDPLLQTLGKHTTSKACLYINKLSDVNMEVLKKIIGHCYSHVKTN